MAKETRKVHISVTSNASKDLNKGTVAAKGLSGSLKGVGAAANIATGGIKAMTMALLSSGVGVLVVGLGSLVAGLGSVINKSTEFEKALSTLEAVSGSSSNEMAQLSDLAKEEKLDEIKRLKTLQQERLQLTNEPSLSSSHKKSGKRNAQKK